MEAQQGPAPKAPPRRRNEERSADCSLTTVDLDGTEHPALRAQEFHRLNRSAVEITAEAQTYDEDGKRDDAFQTYNRALHFIDEAVKLANQGGFSDSDVNRIDELTYKLRMTRKQILERISDLQTTTEESETYLLGPSSSSTLTSLSASNPMTTYSSLPAGNLPSYDDVISSQNQNLSSIRSQTSTEGFNYRELVSALDEIAAEQAGMVNPLPLNAHEIYSIRQNVQIYFISPDDNVSAPSYPSFLRVVVTEQMINDSTEQGTSTSPIPAFLQVGEWTYPLIPRSPVLQTQDGLYIFPDPNAKIPGSSVGLILPSEITAESRQIFEEALSQLLGIARIPRAGHPEDIPTSPPDVAPLSEMGTPTSPTDSARRLSTKIAEGLITGAEAVSKGLVYGATKTSVLFDKGTSFLQSRMDPVKEKTVIKPEVKKGMKVAKTVTGKAVEVSGFLVTQVGTATMALGRYLAPHVQRAGTKILAKTTAKDDVDASRKMDQVLEVTSGAMVGFGTLYLGLESAGTVLANSLANNTVQIIHHRYGDEAGDLANDTAAAAGGAVLTAWNVQQLGPKSMAKKVAKDTGKQVLKNHKDKKSPDVPPPGPSSGP